MTFLSRETTTEQFQRWWAEAERHQDRNRAQCVKMLRGGYNVDAVHPDDGWVNRAQSTLVLCYPCFRQEVKVGSLIALGNEEISERGVIGRYRIVEVTEASNPGPFSGAVTYGFVETVPAFELIPPEGWYA